MGRVRVRFAPSPTGHLHIGGARTALFNWLFARKHGGTFVLRIEDTDVRRSREESARQITEALAWLGLYWDEGPGKGGPYGPYFQSERLAIYQEFADRLLHAGLAYPCYCSPEELAHRRREAQRRGEAPRYDGRCRMLTAAERKQLEREHRRPALRLRTPDRGTTTVRDYIHGDVVFRNEDIGDFVIMKSNGMPVYNFACVVDDLTMYITHVIRAEEHLSNTPRQLMLYEALEADPPVFAHVPMILAPDRSKLSKRHGATSVEEYRDMGFLPEALLNYLALLGWSSEDGAEIMSLQEMIAKFSLDRVAKTAAIYDERKLAWMNGHYLRAMTDERLSEAAMPFLIRAGLIPESADEQTREYVRRVVSLLKERIRTLGELAETARYFFDANFDYDPKGVRKHFSKPGTADLLRDGMKALQTVDPFTVECVERAYRAVIHSRGISGGGLIHPTRLALTGRTVGPSLFDIMVVLGKEECCRRIERAIEFIEKEQAQG